MTKSTGQRRMWTDEDTVIARRLYSELKSYKAVAIEMKRSPSTVQEWLQGLRGTSRVKRTEIEGGLVTVPQERLEHRDQRLATPFRDITGYLMGDPRPGYSALDRVGTKGIFPHSSSTAIGQNSVARHGMLHAE